jgi:hypothetical protein
MATVTALITEIKTYGDDCHVVSWTPLTTTNADGSPLEMPGSADRSVQVDGNFAGSAVLRIEGSNDGVSYYALTDPQGNALDFTAAKIEEIVEIVRYIRPRISSGGTGATSLNVSMLLRRPF